MEAIVIGATIGLLCGIGIAGLSAAHSRDGTWPEAAAIITLG